MESRNSDRPWKVQMLRMVLSIAAFTSRSCLHWDLFRAYYKSPSNQSYNFRSPDLALMLVRSCCQVHSAGIESCLRPDWCQMLIPRHLDAIFNFFWMLRQWWLSVMPLTVISRFIAIQVWGVNPWPEFVETGRSSFYDPVWSIIISFVIMNIMDFSFHFTYIYIYIPWSMLLTSPEVWCFLGESEVKKFGCWWTEATPHLPLLESRQDWR